MFGRGRRLSLRFKLWDILWQEVLVMYTIQCTCIPVVCGEQCTCISVLCCVHCTVYMGICCLLRLQRICEALDMIMKALHEHDQFPTNNRGIRDTGNRGITTEEMEIFSGNLSAEFRSFALKWILRKQVQSMRNCATPKFRKNVLLLSAKRRSLRPNKTFGAMICLFHGNPYAGCYTFYCSDKSEQF